MLILKFVLLFFVKSFFFVYSLYEDSLLALCFQEISFHKNILVNRTFFSYYYVNLRNDSILTDTTINLKFISYIINYLIDET